MPITEADIKKIAALAHLEITDEELHTLAPQVAAIVAYVEQLNELDTSSVEPAIGGLTPEGERTEAAREDRTRPSLGRELALEQVAPQLVFRLNSLLGQAVVTYVEFRVDPQTVREERARLRDTPYERLTRDEAALGRATELEDAADAIHDDELRRRFLLAAGSCMNRTKQ